jgi:hypothetical protein
MTITDPDLSSLTVTLRTSVQLSDRDNRAERDLFAIAYRWVGPGPDDTPDEYERLTADERKRGTADPERIPFGRRILNQLANSGDVQFDSLHAARQWCIAARQWYLTAPVPMSAYTVEWREHAPEDLRRAGLALDAIIALRHDTKTVAVEWSEDDV